MSICCRSGAHHNPSPTLETAPECQPQSAMCIRNVTSIHALQKVLNKPFRASYKVSQECQYGSTGIDTNKWNPT